MSAILEDVRTPRIEPRFDLDLEDELIDSFIDPDEEAEMAELDAIIDGVAYKPPESQLPEITPSEFTEFAIRIPVKGDLERFSFEGREYLREIYDTPARRILMKCGRQTEKSTTLGNKCLAYCGINGNFNVLYVSATAQQAQVFSVDRIKNVIETSPEFAHLVDRKLQQNVLFKQFKNRSNIRIRYAFLSADRVRGIPADKILIDEIQDIITDNIPVIEACAFHSDWKIFCYSGTPKSLDNTIEVYWADFSTQNEWVVPCEACGGTSRRKDTWHWNILGSRNIGKKGLVCAKCKRSINPRHPDAQWSSRQPITKENRNRVSFEGYRIPQLMVPWVDWEEVLSARERFSTAQFNNEVLGLSYDSGVRPLTRAQIKSCCKEEIHFTDLEENARKCHGGVFAGIDWGTGENTYTVISLGGYMGGSFQIFFCHRFTGDDLEPRMQLDKIAKLLHAVRFRCCGADYGGGFDKNDWLMRNFGPTKFVKFQYAPNPSKKIYWQPKLGRYIAHRTEIMSDIFNALKRKQIWLPNWEEFVTPHGEDILNIFSEWNAQLRMLQYKVSPGKTDDTFHSILYCMLASMIGGKMRPDILVPVREGDVLFHG